ncbi:uncharacterized protein KY384_007884 [Bacidia gigantensis]|uniref:uncharacterized protein n=1 Tax=Bacidia gigantensis TaxID=2732470 RepID=UPI001D040CA1|nr:uncharacterized protein KY384_007884 [Bacidia gigantensis]KAG8527730.1 hypothetical protein KY384_007884 [Bacidia gigantensis]
MAEAMPAFYICHDDVKRTAVTHILLSEAQACDYNTLTTTITTDVFQARVRALLSSTLYGDPAESSSGPSVPIVPPLTKDDTYLAPETITPQLLGVVSPWIDLCSPDPIIHNISRQIFKMEVAFAAFCGLNALVVPAPQTYSKRKDGLVQYANAIQEALEIGAYIHFSICTPLMDSGENQGPSDSSIGVLGRQEYLKNAEVPSPPLTDGESKHNFFGSWDAWDTIRSICKYNARLLVDLVIPRKLPPSDVCLRWMSEPLRILSIDASTFYPNPSGYPSLTANHRMLINQYMGLRHAPCILLTGIDPISSETLTTTSSSGQVTPGVFPTPSEAQANEARRRSTKLAPQRYDPLAHIRYLRWLQSEQPKKTYLEVQGEGYQDYLQAPLQPLTDNLESMTYEVFEKDPVKYDLYEQAISNALNDWRSQNKPPTVKANPWSWLFQATNVPIELWALEKNPNACVMLQRQNAVFWNNQVRLVSSDMRQWKGPERLDEGASTLVNGAPQSSRDSQPYRINIVISELLGSFGDNELSPECLDGIVHLLDSTNGISIPASYSTYLTPIAAPRLHADIAARAITDPSASTTPYVVLLQSFDYLSRQQQSISGPFDSSTSPTTDARQPSSGSRASSFMSSPPPTIYEAWSFSHAHNSTNTSSSNMHNNRHSSLTFPLTNRGICHGLAGYFESVLYPASANKPAVELSTNPLTMEQKSSNMMSWFPIFFPLKTPLYAPDGGELIVSMWRKTDGRGVWYEWVIEVWGDKERLGVSDMMSSKEKACLM